MIKPANACAEPQRKKDKQRCARAIFFSLFFLFFPFFFSPTKLFLPLFLPLFRPRKNLANSLFLPLFRQLRNTLSTTYRCPIAASPGSLSSSENALYDHIFLFNFIHIKSADTFFLFARRLKSRKLKTYVSTIKIKNKKIIYKKEWIF